MFPSSILNDTEIERLRRFSTPTIANAVESFDVRPRTAGFMSPVVKALFPEQPPLVGYAVTATIRASLPRPDAACSPIALLQAKEKIPGPAVAVVHDLDAPVPVGAFWGEVQSNVYRRFGFVGAVTDGGVRDLEEVRQLGFGLFAASPLVSHAYVHLVDVGEPVEVGGVRVGSGELVHADRHGVLVVPSEVANRVADAAAELEERERALIAATRAPEFSLQDLVRAWVEAGLP